MFQWRYTAELLCLEMYSILANTSYPNMIWSTVSLCRVIIIIIYRIVFEIKLISHYKDFNKQYSRISRKKKGSLQTFFMVLLAACGFSEKTK